MPSWRRSKICCYVTTTLCCLTTAGEDLFLSSTIMWCFFKSLDPLLVSYFAVTSYCSCKLLLLWVRWVTCVCLRIQPLSDALGDLYKEFNALKERLAELTAKFDGVEAFVDDVRSGRKPAPPRGEPRPAGSLPGGETEAAAGARPPGRRNRVVVRRIKKPAASQDWRKRQNHNPVWCEVMFCFNIIASN